MLAEIGLAAALGTAVKAETAYVRIPHSTEQLAIHCIEPRHARGAAVLFIHGSTFPTLLASGYQFSAGDSWLSFVAARGYLACGLDFLGYGASSRPEAMLQAANRGPALLRTPAAAAQIAVAIDYLGNNRRISGFHLVAHSWGTIPAAAFSADHSPQLKSLTLFGPVVPVAQISAAGTTRGAWFALDAMIRLDQLRFKDTLPPGVSLLEPAVDRRWARELVAANVHVPEDPPETVRVPEGPVEDIAAAQAGIYPYAAGKIRVPVLVVHGSYDSIVDAAHARNFLDRFTGSPLKWHLQVHAGTHVMHLERNRRSLYEIVSAFIAVVEAQR